MNTKSTKGELISLFSTPVVKTNIGRSFTKEEAESFDRIPMQEYNTLYSEQQGLQSKRYNIFDIFAEELNDIKSFCEHELKRYLEEIEGIDTDLAGLRITQSWFNKIKPQKFHAIHDHRNSYLSGVLYINCLQNDSLNFEDRDMGRGVNIEFQKKKATLWNAGRAKVGVKEGDLIIFPSSIQHFVDVNETNKERISLSFNTFPMGKLGNERASHLKL
jgi:uncharacterized protein (TIGR02466 family)